MNKKEFIAEISEKMSEYGEVVERDVVRTNKSYHGLQVNMGVTSPVFDVDGMYKRYSNGTPIEELYSELETAIRNTPPVAADVIDWETAKNRLFICTINTERNPLVRTEKIAGDIGNAVYLRSPMKGGVARIQVNDDLLNAWGKTFEEVCAAAKENTEADEINIFTLGSMLSAEDTYTSTWVVTNNSGLDGFAQATVHSKEIRDKVGDRFYIIPSSIHEALVMPCSDQVDPEALRAIIRSVNSTMVSEEDFLSDELFVYTPEDGIRVAECAA